MFLKQAFQIASPQTKNSAWNTTAALIRWNRKSKEKYVAQNYAQKMHSTLSYYSELWKIWRKILPKNGHELEVEINT